jgi:hypothetical protein
MADVVTFYTRWRHPMQRLLNMPPGARRPAFEVLCFPGDRLEVHGHAGYEMHAQLAICGPVRWLDPT